MYDECRACGQRADFAIECVWFRHVTPDEKANVTRRLRGASHRAVAQQRLHLRRDADGMTIIGVIERLDAERIARQDQFLIRSVP